MQINKFKFGKFIIITKILCNGSLYFSKAYYKNITIGSNKMYTTEQESVDDVINEIGKTFHETVKELI